MRFVELTQEKSKEAVFVNPDLVGTVVDVPDKQNVAYVKIADKYGFEVAGTAREVVALLQGEQLGTAH